MTSRLISRIMKATRRHSAWGFSGVWSQDCRTHPGVASRWCAAPFRLGNTNRGPHRWYCPACHPKGCPFCRGLFCHACYHKSRLVHEEEAVEPEERRSGDRMQFKRKVDLKPSRAKNELKRERRRAGGQGA